MPESYSPTEFIAQLNSQNPNGAKFDPYNTQTLRQKLLSQQTQTPETDIITQAQQELDKQRQERIANTPEAIRDKAIAEAQRQIDSIRNWLLKEPNRTYSPTEIDDIVNKLHIVYDEDNGAIVVGDLTLDKLTTASNLVFPKNYKGILSLRKLEKAEGLVFPDEVENGLFMPALKQARNVILPKYLKGDLHLISMKDVQNITFPEKVSGSLTMPSLDYGQDLKLPRIVEHKLDLIGLKDASRIELPEEVGWFILMPHLEAIRGLILPNKIGGNINLSRLPEIQKETLRKTRTDLAEKIF